MQKALPNCLPIPAPEVIVNRWPGRKIMRQQTPLAAGAKQIENRVHHLPHINVSGALPVSVILPIARFRSSSFSIPIEGEAYPTRLGIPGLFKQALR
jgi:hypothetical protein